MGLTRTPALGIALLASTCLVFADGEPSSGAQGMPGATGTFEFKPADWKEGTTSWWKDSDGIDPGMAGCHLGTDERSVSPPRLAGAA